jgi:uncharacterized DUF497 family protein
MYLQKYVHYVKILLKKDLFFSWDRGNVGKNEKHGVSKAEIEEFFKSQVHVSYDFKHSNSEQRYLAIGKSSKGRYMVVAFTIREESIRPISARHMNKREIEKYEKEITKI